MYAQLLRYYRQIKKCEHLDPDKLNRINFDRLKKLALYAFENVDYYRELYESNDFDPRTLSSQEDLSRLPVVEKEHFRNAPIEKRTSAEYRNFKLIESSTSGTTGKSLKFFTNNFEVSQQTLKWLYVLRKYGYRPTDNLVQIYRPLPNPSTSFIQKLGFFRRRIISILDSMDIITDELKNTRVDVLVGMKSALAIIGEELLRRNLIVRPRFIVTTGEVLTDNDRRILKKYFAARTMDIYSSAETGNIAFTCPKCDYMHLHSDSIFFNAHENTDAPYISSLDNRATPFINYNLGDGIIYPDDDYDCGCGSRFPLIKSIGGRDVDVAITSSGRKYNIQYFFAKLQFIDDLDQYKIIQDKNGVITLKLKINKPMHENDKENLRRAVLEVFTEITATETMKVELVDNIPLEKHGKLRVMENALLNKARNA